MTENEFWEVIELSNKKSKDNLELQKEILLDLLVKKEIQDLIDFDAYEMRFRAISYLSPLWCVGYIVNCGCSDDGFEDFRDWIIAQGKEVFENAMKDADSLLPAIKRFKKVNKDEDVEFEEMRYMAGDAYELKTGNNRELFYELEENCTVEIPDYPTIILEWNDDDEESMRRMCPKIYAEYVEGLIE